MPLRGTLNDENWHRAWYHLAVGAVSTLTHGQTGFRHYSDSNRNSMNVPPTALTLWGQGGLCLGPRFCHFLFSEQLNRLIMLCVQIV